VVTEVAFHFGAPDRVAYTCRLLRKATARGARLVVRSNPVELAELDVALWNVSTVDFIAHCAAGAPDDTRARSAVLLVEDGAELQAEAPVLVNLGADVPVNFDQFKRVIEIVSTDEADRMQARKRWKLYSERGYQIVRHDVQSKAGD
jgi:DNA polymerase-3 subunit chi